MFFGAATKCAMCYVAWFISLISFFTSYKAHFCSPNCTSCVLRDITYDFSIIDRCCMVFLELVHFMFSTVIRTADSSNKVQLKVRMVNVTITVHKALKTFPYSLSPSPSLSPSLARPLPFTCGRLGEREGAGTIS